MIIIIHPDHNCKLLWYFAERHLNNYVSCSLCLQFYSIYSFPCTAATVQYSTPTQHHQQHQVCSVVYVICAKVIMDKKNLQTML